MRLGSRWQRFASLSAVLPRGRSLPDGSPPLRSRYVRIVTAAIILVGVWLTFLISYGYAIYPYLVSALLITSAWRLRAGAVCLLVSLAILAVIEVNDAHWVWREVLQDLLALTLLGLVFMGTRALLDELERQWLTERRLTAELSAAVGKLRESERQQMLATQALAERHHLLRAILDAVDNGIFLVDPEGRIGFANERLGELLGLDTHCLIGEEAATAILAPLAARCREGAVTAVPPFADGELEITSHLIELIHPTPRLLCQFSAPVRDDSGTPRGCLYVYSDLPDRDRLQELLEQRVAERTGELEAAHEQLLRAERLAALGQFSATIAHELRNPLNVVRLSAHYITTHTPNQDEKMQRNIDHLNRQTDRACDIIDDLLAFSRLPAPELEPISVNALVREVVMTLPLSDRISVEWTLAPDLPEAFADPRQIEQAVENLGLNAIQAMPDGGRLMLATHQANDHVTITIRDTGPGIPEELRERVFEPFFSTKVSGTGLGLPLVREIALAHGGDICLQSAPGEGACFTLTLPLASVVPRAERPRSETSPHLSTSDG
jgi:PAS domain S-box-containing protein